MDKLITYWNKRFFEAFYLIVALLFIAKGRWTLSVLNPLPLNPDEVQSLANALRMFRYGFSWDAVDGGTNGPLDSFILSWPYLFGCDITVNTLHLTALILLSLIFVFTYLTIRLFSNCFFAILFSAPIAFFYALTKQYDFLHYSSELLPVALLVISCYFFVRLLNQKGHSSSIQICFLGFILGAIPFAKLQAMPIACVTGLFIFLVLLLEKKKKKIILYTISCSIFSIIFLLPLAIHGTFNDFYLSYIVGATTYIQQSLPLSFLNLHQLINADSVLLMIIYFSIYLGAITLLMSLFISPMNKAHFIKLIYFISLLIFVVYSIVKPGRSFPHYLQFLPPFLLILVGYLASIFYERSTYKISYSVLCFGTLLFFIGPEGYLNVKNTLTSKWNEKGLSFSWYQPNLLEFLFPKAKDTLLVWGWMPQWYGWFNMVPATRTASSQREIEGGVLQQYYRKRLLDDLTQSHPNFIVDAVAGNSFGYNERNKHLGLHSFQELNEIINKDYILLGNPQHRNDTCAKIYATKEKADELNKKLVEFNSISASGTLSELYIPQHIDSYSVTEDTCIDYWLLPEKQLGSLDIYFKHEELVKKILILNTKNGKSMDRATNELLISLRNNNKEKRVINVKMRPYPQWTTINLEELVLADSIRIEILSFIGNGAGLNEVKVVRKEGME